MRLTLFLHRSVAGIVATALVAGAPAATAGGAPQRPKASGPAVRVAQLPAGTQRPTSEVALSIGEGELITLPANVANVWTSNPGVADVYVASARQIHLYGKDFGQATVFATTASGQVVYATNVRVAQNLTSVDKMLKLAMPEADITVTTVGQLAVLNGTVASPEDSAQAQRLVLAALNPGVDTTSATAQLKVQVINRLKTSVPLQVNLQVRFAEVSRSFVKNLSVNLTNRDSGSVLFGIQQGTQGSITTNTTGTVDAASGAAAGGKIFTFPTSTNGSLLGIAGHFLGTDLLASLDFGETIGQVTTLATPNLTALSGETGTFLAGGEIPIPIAQALGTTSIEYKQYGVSLAYTPVVLSDGRISLRVRPEVSQLTSSGSVTYNGTTIPALSTRRAETTVELGSGQSFMIAGLLQNSHNNSITKTPGLGDIPILGALFRSNSFQRNETELVIVITPYLVKPVNARDIKLPTDGYQAPSDADRYLFGQLSGAKNTGQRPVPTMATPDAAPAVGAVSPVPITPAVPQAAAQAPAASSKKQKKKGSAAAEPGFSLN